MTTETQVTILIKEKENFIQSLAKDLVTFSFLALCIYVSIGSSFYTFLTGIMFITFVGVKAATIVKKSSTTFKSKREAIEWLEK